ncbi:50S ribosomal protein L25 [Alicyclobacillus cycloheptanicus]|uniref:Large ribosomal subunit protein bL25 n=1 Tax=Alicyclobacillus cycloheptanicus TaxID=1457 RepID=A0ABT9XJ62_9BACL|nr:50S ribosomal protein L25 [Alicyclobacillus cycloheptanicus]MDQ0190160.1 large subunit ribosomal protein L25 [Alicyclobacillus cycloheptanicus]WDM02585.1 50S ribosomal protein L25 [Alicyclobacillus cycloheptanicus]
MEHLIMEAAARTGHAALSQLRQDGLVPAVLYGGQEAPVSITVAEKDLERAKVGSKNLVELRVNGENVSAFWQDVQRDPVSRRILHADFYRVDLSAHVDVRVPLHLHGVEAVEKRGGVVQQQTRELEIRALPSDVPEYISVYVGDMEIGDHIEVAKVVLPPGVTSRTSGQVVVASVIAPKQAASVPSAETPPGAESTSES